MIDGQNFLNDHVKMNMRQYLKNYEYDYTTCCLLGYSCFKEGYNFFCRRLHKKMKFPIQDFCSKCNQICSFPRIWTHLLKKSLMENLIFCAVLSSSVGRIYDRLCNFLTSFYKLKVIYFIVNNKPSQSLFWKHICKCE